MTDSEIVCLGIAIFTVFILVVLFLYEEIKARKGHLTWKDKVNIKIMNEEFDAENKAYKDVKKMVEQLPKKGKDK